MTTSETLLREAAAKLRKMARAAVPGPWYIKGEGGLTMDGLRDSYSIWSYHRSTGAALARINRHYLANAEWIATMSPVVAETLAQLFEQRADQLGQYGAGPAEPDLIGHLARLVL